MALGTLVYFQLKAGAERELERELADSVSQAVQQFNARLGVAEANLRRFVSLDLIERYLLNESEVDRYELLQPSVLKIFAGHQQATPDDFEIRVLLPDGYEDTRSVLRDLPNQTEEEGETAWFERIAHADQDIQSQILRHPDTNQIALVTSFRVKLNDRRVDPVSAPAKLRGYVVISSRLDYLRTLSTATGSSAERLILFTDATGNKLFSSNGGEADITDIKTHAREQSLFVAAHAGSEYVMRASEVHHGLFVVAARDANALLYPIKRLGTNIVIITLVAVLMTSAVLLFALRSLLLSPLEKLRNATQTIGDDGSLPPIEINRQDEIGDLAKSFIDMGQRLAESHAHVRHIAYHDSLTGLPNRRQFADSLTRTLHQARREQSVVGVLFLDIDDFKRINDSLGHDAGDVLLKEFSARLTTVVRGADLVARANNEIAVMRPPPNTIARIGGDEFIILLTNLRQTADCTPIATRLLKAITEPLTLSGEVCQISTSIGIATFPKDGDDTSTLLKNADIALYQAKGRGKNAYAFFDKAMNDAAREQLEIETGLRKAILDDELVLHYQAKVDTHTGALAGAEALVRWLSPSEGMVPPGTFIPVAEESGLIDDIGQWVLRETCLQINRWRAKGLVPVPIAINVSNRQLRRSSFAADIEQTLTEFNVGPELVEIELTETSVMDAGAQGIETLKAFRAYGLGISLDDFGTGHSSLASLKQLPIDTVKIDREFVQDIGDDDDNTAMVATIVAMSKTLNLKAVAEGVETEGQLDFLKACGCPVVQGYLLSRPVPAAQFEQLLRNRAIHTSPLSITSAADS